MTGKPGLVGLLEIFTWLLVHEIDHFHLCSKGLLISFAYEARDMSKT